MKRGKNFATKRTRALDEGDIEVYHPGCRTRILITEMRIKHGHQGGAAAWLSVVGICHTCGKYVYLTFGKETTETAAAEGA